MARYIDADATLDTMRDEMAGTGYQSIAMDVIQYAPTADVVEVVRCGNCKNAIGKAPLLSEKLCLFHGISVPGNYYCASGERRTDNDL